MRRNFSQSDFLSSELTEGEDDNDPRSSLVNLADVMLVFACGLMLALVSYWNLDISAMQEVTKGAEMTEVRDIEQMEGKDTGGSGFVEKGTVYQDPMTGKYFMMEEDAADMPNSTSNTQNNDTSQNTKGGNTTQNKTEEGGNDE